ncbi:MAG TPA: hypothetical protein VGO31_15545 [Microbacteriaceae bacterium]|nr:hypothetical protein [Microbacteriaceae bacterium]
MLPIIELVVAAAAVLAAHLLMLRAARSMGIPLAAVTTLESLILRTG